MVLVISIFQKLAGSRRNKHKCAWPNELSTQMLNLTRLFAELFYFMLHVPSQAINTRDLTLLLALMKFRA